MEPETVTVSIREFLSKSKRKKTPRSATPSPPLSPLVSPVHYPPSSSFNNMLYILDVDMEVSREDILNLLRVCEPVEVKLYFTGDGMQRGIVLFKSPTQAERAYAVFNGTLIGPQNSYLHFSMRDPTASPDHSTFEPEPNAHVLLVEHLSITTINNHRLYDLFRPHGPLSMCRTVVTSSGKFEGRALIQYFDQKDADRAVVEMNGLVVDGQSIKVSQYSSANCEDKMTIPSEAFYTASFSPPLTNKDAPVDEQNLPGIDPCNLYIKNLDPSFTSTDLFHAFRHYGRIVSARVMTDATSNQSKGFGFVSFNKPESAAQALREMNGKDIGGKRVVVAYHEPKKLREAKLAAVRSVVQQNQAVEYTYTNDGTEEEDNEGDGLVNPYLADGTFNEAFFTSLSFVRHDTRITTLRRLLNGQIKRHCVHLSESECERAIESLLDLHIADIVDAIKSPELLKSKIDQLIQQRSMEPSPILRPDAPAFYPSQNKPTPSPKPDPFTPINPETSLPSLSQNHTRTIPTVYPRKPPTVATVMTERTSKALRLQLTLAVQKVTSEGVEDVVDMLLTLGRKERSLCLFNSEYLREKVRMAKEALEVVGEEDEEDQEAYAESDNDFEDGLEPENLPKAVGPMVMVPLQRNSSNSFKPPNAVKYQANRIPSTDREPPQIAKSSISHKKVPAPVEQKKPSDSSPKKEIMATMPIAASEAPRFSEDEEASRRLETDAFLSALRCLSIEDQKEVLGARLFPAVKATGIRRANRVTVRLLDTVELRQLAHAIHQPDTLKRLVMKASMDVA
ncbi:uncharacterized protein VTP21DRAFT_8074 [Calcarisporiella thermophila]|uniref:uncharacterized protein n=1 Tax=Calcarisporiella thermophila TaxID=911321 RepID=UPI003743EBC5